jgi:hypothetical protein
MVVPEATLCILSIPIGVAVDRFSLTFAFQQKLFASCSLLIAVSHTALAAGFNPVAGVLGLGVVGPGRIRSNRPLTHLPTLVS